MRILAKTLGRATITPKASPTTTSKKEKQEVQNRIKKRRSHSEEKQNY